MYNNALPVIMEHCKFMQPNQKNQPTTAPSGVNEPVPGQPTASSEHQAGGAPPWPGGPSSGPPTAVNNYPVPPPPKKKFKKGGKSRWRSVISTVLLFFLAPLIALFIATFVLQSYQVEGASMETTLQNGDRLIVSKIGRSWARLTDHSYTPNRGDIVIFNQSGLPDAPFTEEKQLIKRVIGLPGERVVIEDGKITVYNQDNPEGFNPDTETGYLISSATTPGNIDQTISDDEIFVVGDNRTNSEDSRYFGPVNTDKLVGKLSLRILPVDKAQHF